jgi:hypothetical protein
MEPGEEPLEVVILRSGDVYPPEAGRDEESRLVAFRTARFFGLASEASE